MLKKGCFFTMIIGIFAVSIPCSYAERIGDVAQIQGVRENALVGYGLVVGLDGTGDQTTQTPFTAQSISNMLSKLGISVPTGNHMQLKNVAAVMVTAKLPPFSRVGKAVDVVVSSLGNARSLRGGTLIMTPLKGADSQVYAIAQGNLLVGGIGASAKGNQVSINQMAGGRIPNGATIERELPTLFDKQNVLHLHLNQNDFTRALMISDAINRVKKGTAMAVDSSTVALNMPSDGSERVRFLSTIQNINIGKSPIDAKVVINSKTGTVVMNRSVILDNCAVTQGSLSVVIHRQFHVNQPDTPFTQGKTVVTPDTQIGVKQAGGALSNIEFSADLNQVVSSLNALGATPAELMSILEALKSAGCLHAVLEII